MSVMEEPLRDEAEVPVDREDHKASAEAVLFMSSIEAAELQRCVFADSLLTVSEGGRALGTFTVTVEFARRDQQPCMLLHAQSQGTIDQCPCGTTVTAYLTAELEVLEEHYHEFVKLDDNCFEKKWHMVQQEGQLVINKVTAVGEDVTTEQVSHPLSSLRGLVTEGSNLLLLRLAALRRTVPAHMTFLSFDQELSLIRSTVRELGLKRLEVGGSMVEVFGVERTLQTVESPTQWQSYYLADGHLASRVQVGSPVTMRLSRLPSQQDKDLEKNLLHMKDMLISSRLPLGWTEVNQHIPVPDQDAGLVPGPNTLVWEEDMQMCSNFLDKKDELKADHTLYLRKHPEIRALMSDFLQFLLLRKPDDVFQFAREYFLPFASDCSP